MAGKRGKRLIRAVKNLFVPHDGNKRHPHLLRSEVALGVLALVIFLEIGMLSQVFVFSRVQWMLASVLPGVITALTNEARAEEYLPALKESPVLKEAAQDKAEDMAMRGYFSHESPDGTLPWYWFDKHGYTYKYAGENLAIDFTDSATLVDAWLASPTHKANIVKGGYTEIGIGMATGTYQGRETVFVVQFFGSQRGARIAEAAPRAAPESATLETSEEAEVLGASVELKEEGEGAGVVNRVLASPRTFGTYVLGGLALFFALLLVIGFLPIGKHVPHPKALVNGAAVMALLLGIMVTNQGILKTTEVAVVDAQHASVVFAIE